MPTRRATTTIAVSAIAAISVPMRRDATASAPSGRRSIRAAPGTTTSRCRRRAAALLTTQLYFPDEPANQRDGLFRRELLMRVAEAGDGARRAVRFRARYALEPCRRRGTARRGSAQGASGRSRSSSRSPEGISGVVGPVPPRRPGAGVAACRAPGRSRRSSCITRGGLVPAAIVARELKVRLIETVCVASYHDYTKQGELQRAQGRRGRHRIERSARQGRADRRRPGRHRKDREGGARAAARARISPRSTPSRWAGRWSTPSSPRCRRTPGSIFPGTPGLAFQPPIREGGA